jgi:hypothetical protein
MYNFFFKFIFSCKPFDNCSHYLPTTLGKMVENFATGVVDTSGNLPPVSLIPVVNLDLRISPQIFEKIRIGPNGILWCWEETDS